MQMSFNVKPTRASRHAKHDMRTSTSGLLRWIAVRSGAAPVEGVPRARHGRHRHAAIAVDQRDAGTERVKHTNGRASTHIS